MYFSLVPIVRSATALLVRASLWPHSTAEGHTWDVVDTMNIMILWKKAALTIDISVSLIRRQQQGECLFLTRGRESLRRGGG